MNIEFISSIIHLQKCKIMYSYAPFFKAYFYQCFIQFTMHYLIHLIQNVQLCIFMHNGEALCYFWAIFRSVVHNGRLKDFLMHYHPKTIILIIAIANQHHALSISAHLEPHKLHTHFMSQAYHTTHTPVLKVMSFWSPLLGQLRLRLSCGYLTGRLPVDIHGLS